ncbi:hypothetical protein GCM10022393_26870 [Aquimarina addita]|uniref:Uncharacterized protein n=1 Tax=Aquimarina addita TaxID=870485 RepID=A0ABP6UNZ2_9FLAO
MQNSDLKINFDKTEFIPYGCGPSVHAIFNVKNKSETETWFKTDVADLSSNEYTIFYIKEQNGNLNVRHGMCAGAFNFSREGRYKVRFSPMNIDGKSLSTTDWITFDSLYSNLK